MHDVDSRGFRYTLAAAGMAASLVFLLASAFANYRYGSSLAPTKFDGYIYGSAAAACDVLMAAAPFFFFAGLRNRSITQMLAAALVWGVMTSVAAVSAISQTSANRIDALSARISKTTSYSDTREELVEARAQRKKLGDWAKTENHVQAEINRHKMKREWIASSECVEISGKTQREYCSNYQVLLADLAAAQQVAKLDTRIETLVAKSDKAMEGGGASIVASEADPGAKTIALISGYDLRTTQSMIVGLIAVMFLVGAGIGPYASWAIMEAVGDRELHLPLPVIDADATDITPLVEGKLEEVKPLAIAAPQKPKGAKIEVVPPADAAPEWKALLGALAFPGEGWQPPRDKKGDFVLREKDHPQVAAWRFFCYAQATGFLGEFTPEQIDEAISRTAKVDFRVETGSRVVKPELEGIRRWVKKEGPPVRWVIKPAPIDAVKQMLVNRRILPETALLAPVVDGAAPPATPAPEATEEPKPNGIKAIALRRFFKASDQPENDGTLLN